VVKPSQTACVHATRQPEFAVTTLSIQRLVNGSGGDPCLYLDFPGEHNALLFDTGELAELPTSLVADVGAIFYSHFHMDHFVGFDRVLRANINHKKTILVYGPSGTAQRLGARLGSYQFYRFPFMRLRFLVHEIDPDDPAVATVTEFDCQNDFRAEPVKRPLRLKGGVCHDAADCRVRFAFVSHSVTCINYAMELKRGYRFDREKARTGVLRPGAWVREVMAAMRKPRKDRPLMIRVGGGEFDLGHLVADYFTMSPHEKIVFCTDTRINDDIRPTLLDLASKATRLYADAYYPDDHAKRADKYGHMTITQVAELARDADVAELFLIHIGAGNHHRAVEMLATAREIFPATRMQFGEQTW
jgi:ribonuclease Z